MRKKLLFIILFLAICGFQYHFFGNFYLKDELLNNLITALSIIFGFYITSLTIFSSSKYVSSLYKFTDKNNKTLTLLNVLINKYRIGLIIILFSIVYLLGIQFLLSQSEKNFLFLSNPWVLPLFGVIISNFWFSYFMLNDLINVVLQEGKNKDK